jgi:hypothetical protein
VDLNFADFDLIDSIKDLDHSDSDSFNNHEIDLSVEPALFSMAIVAFLIPSTIRSQHQVAISDASQVIDPLPILGYRWPQCVMEFV